MPKTRHECREIAFMLIFDKSFNDELSMDEIYNTAVEEEIIESDIFSYELAIKTENNLENIDKVISDNLSGWTISRISRVSLAVLRLALAEIMYMDEIPTGVSINEAVEIVKTFSTESDASFVNGVLGNVSRSLCI